MLISIFASLSVLIFCPFGASLTVVKYAVQRAGESGIATRSLHVHVVRAQVVRGIIQRQRSGAVPPGAYYITWEAHTNPKTL